MRALLRFTYLVALGLILLVGTIAAVVLVTRIWSPAPDSSLLERLLFGAVFIATGLGSWAGLAYLYRRTIPLPCGSCGRAAWAVSLNPVRISCGACGHIETIRFWVHGAS